MSGRPDVLPSLKTLSFLLSQNPLFQFLPTSTVSEETLQSGLSLYYNARNILDSEQPSHEEIKKAQQDLQIAAKKHHDYFASLFLISQATEELINNIDQHFDPEGLLQQAVELARYHLTPGCIVLTRTYLYVATYFQHHEQFDTATHFLEMACIPLFAAKELAGKSATQIHNAYFGGSLLEVERGDFNIISEYSMANSDDLFADVLNWIISLMPEDTMNRKKLQLFHEDGKSFAQRLNPG